MTNVDNAAAVNFLRALDLEHRINALKLEPPSPANYLTALELQRELDALKHPGDPPVSIGLHYDPPTWPPSGREQPGMTLFGATVAKLFPGFRNDGGYNPKDTTEHIWPNVKTGPSAHADGRAKDFMVTQFDQKTGFDMGCRLAWWAVLNAPRWGVQEVIWNRQRWDAESNQWKPYHGLQPHTDHVHIALNKQGAVLTTVPA